MKLVTLSRSALLLAMFSGVAFAKVDSQSANQLTANLTPMGAEKAGNAAGTIPAYTGGLAHQPNANPLKNVFAAEQALFVIDHSNMQQHLANLSDGQIALLNKFPNTYKLPIYKTYRTASYPAAVYEKAKKNALTTELVGGGNGLKDFDETVPFAIPKNGLEVVWNHISRYRGGSIERNVAQIPVQRNGEFTPIKTTAQLTSPFYMTDAFDAKADDNVLFYYTQAIKSPARLTGNVLLVHETIDQVTQPRLAWSYNAGQRRVRRAPQVAYDAPGQATDGLRTADQLDMFNGAPDRYDWKLVGKQEMYIPYNAYLLSDGNAKYDDIIMQGHINPDFTRYELHRVWKVEATLKAGARHIYAKRTFYIDEDSYQIAMADHYDNRNQLWRVAEGHALQFVNANVLWYAAATNYDLISGRYIAELNNEERDAFVFDKKVQRKDFTAAAIRRSGVN